MPVATAEALSVLDLYSAASAVVGQDDARKHLAVLLKRQRAVAAGAQYATVGSRPSGKTLQLEFLQVAEGGIVTVPESDDDPIGMELDTARILHIGAGAFVGIDRIAARRVTSDRELEQEPEVMADLFDPRDFIRFGMVPELVGRMSTIIALRPLRE